MSHQVQVWDYSKVPPEAVEYEEDEEGGVHADQGDQQEVERVAHVFPEKTIIFCILCRARRITTSREEGR